MLLEVKDLEVSYGLIQALQGVSLQVREGEIVTIIGANGAGKTTLLHTISGLLHPQKGSILYNGADITKWSTDQIVAAGIIQVPEGRQIFSELSVLENMKMGAFSQKKVNREDLERLFVYFPRLRERIHQKGGSLSGGEQQMLAMARALMGRPKLLILDEPSMGLAPIVVKDIFKIIGEIKEAGTTIVLIEQNAKLALKIADYAYVLETGTVQLAGPTEKLRNDPEVQKIFLGG